MRKHGSKETTDLQETTLEKDLGVHMDSELKFSQHLERQVNKANRLLGLIRRSFDYLDGDTMKLLFAALVRPHLEFGNCVWAPYLEKDKKLIEGVLRRATKVVGGLKDLSYEQRLKRIGLPSMVYRRLRGDMIETYKFTHCLYATQDRLFTIDTKSVTRGHSYKLLKPRVETTLRQNFFTQRVIERWNSLPANVVEAPSVNAFKNRLDAVMSSYMHSVEVPPTHIRSD